MIQEIKRSERDECETKNLRVLRSIQEIEQIRPLWEKMQWHPNADIDFFLTVIASRPSILRPHLILLTQGGQPQALLIGRIEKIPLECRLGYQVLLRPTVRSLTIVHGGLLGNITKPHAALLVDELQATLKRGEADLIQFNGLDADSDLCQYARKKPAPLCRDYFIHPHPHWQMSLPPSLDDFLHEMKAKHRYWIRRIERQLEQDHPGRIKIRYYRKPGDIEPLCRDAEDVAKLTYQRGISAGFVDNRELRCRLKLAGARGWLRAYMLYIDQLPAAFWIGTHYGKTFYLDYTGYDPKFKKYEPGTILFMKMVDDLCRNGIREIDCGSGDAFYKERYGKDKWLESSVLMFAPTIRGVLLSLGWMMTAGISRLAHSLVRHFGLHQKIKKLWRTHITLEPTTETPM